MIKQVVDSEQLPIVLPVMASEGFLKSKSNEYGWFVSDDFVLPYFIEKKFIFKRMVFSHQGICVKQTEAIDSLNKTFLNQVVTAAGDMGITMIYQPLTYAIFKHVPDHVDSCEFGTYQVDLREEEQQLFANLHQKHRNVIRKAEKIGVEIFSGAEYLEECFELIKATMVRQSRPYVSLEQLQKYHSNLGDKVSFYVAKYENTVCGCAVLFWDKDDCCYYLHGGSAAKTITGAMNLLHWRAMIDMRAKGVKFYDFVGARVKPIVGSKQESMQRFKSRFGAEMKQGYLWKKPIKPFAYWLYTKIAKLNAIRKGQTYKGDIIDEESKG